MEIPVTQLPPGDPRLVEAIVGQLKTKGIFDQFRKECLADVDTKPAFQNLRQRVEGHVNKYLEKSTWKNDMNKNQLRDGVRKHVNSLGILESGIDAIITQVVNPKIKPLILPYVEDTVYAFLQIDRPKRERQECIKEVPVEPLPIQPTSAPQQHPEPHHHHQPHPLHPQQHLPHPQQQHPQPHPQQQHPQPHPQQHPAHPQQHPPQPQQHHPQPQQQQQPAPIPAVETKPNLLPMETDVISSEEDDILARESPEAVPTKSSPSSEAEAVKEENEDACDGFDSFASNTDGGEGMEESVATAVERLHLSQDSESARHAPTTAAKTTLPLFDDQSLDSISSNSSGLTFSTLSGKGSPGSKKSVGDGDKSVGSPELMQETRSTTSTPLVDEKRLEEEISQSSVESGPAKEYPLSEMKYGDPLPQFMDTTESINLKKLDDAAEMQAKQSNQNDNTNRNVEITNVGQDSDNQNVASGSMAPQEEESQESKGSLSKISSESEKSELEEKVKSEKSEGEISSSSPDTSDSENKGKQADHCKSEDKLSSDSSKSRKSKSDHKSRHDSHSRERDRDGKHHRDKERSKHSKSRDDHHSHRDKDKKHHRRDKDHDGDRDRARSHHTSSGGSGSGSGNGSGSSGKSSGDRDKDKERSSHHSSDKSNEGKSRRDRSEKSTSKGGSKSDESSDGKTEGTSGSKSESRSDKIDTKSSSKSETKSEKIDSKSSSRSDYKSDKAESKSSSRSDSKSRSDRSDKKHDSHSSKHSSSSSKHRKQDGEKSSSDRDKHSSSKDEKKRKDEDRKRRDSKDERKEKGSESKTPKTDKEEKDSKDTKHHREDKDAKRSRDQKEKYTKDVTNSKSGKEDKIPTKEEKCKEIESSSGSDTDSQDKTLPMEVKQSGDEKHIGGEVNRDTDTPELKTRRARKRQSSEDDSSNTDAPNLKTLRGRKKHSEEDMTSSTPDLNTLRFDNNSLVLVSDDGNVIVLDYDDKTDTDAPSSSSSSPIRETEDDEPIQNNNRPITSGAKKRKLRGDYQNNNMNKEEAHNFEGFQSCKLDTRLFNYLQKMERVPLDMDVDFNESFDDSDLHMEVSQDNFGKLGEYDEFLACMEKLGAVVRHLDDGEPKPKKRRGRPPKAKLDQAENEDEKGVNLESPVKPIIAKRRGRPPKVVNYCTGEGEEEEEECVDSEASLVEPAAKRKGKGRPSKVTKDDEECLDSETSLVELTVQRRGRGRPPKVKKEEEDIAGSTPPHPGPRTKLRRVSTSSSASSSTSHSGSPRQPGRWGTARGVAKGDTTTLIQQQDSVTSAGYLLTPEDDGNRTSSRDYEVDYSQRINTYSPLSPASDSSADDGKNKIADTRSAGSEGVGSRLRGKDSPQVKPASTWRNERRNIPV